MFDAFGVEFRSLFWNAQRSEEGDDDHVPTLAGCGQFVADFSQENSTIGLCDYVAVSLEAGDGAVDGYMGDPEAPGQIDHTGFPLSAGQVGDGFDVVLGNFRGVITPGMLQALGLQGGRADGFLGLAEGLFQAITLSKLGIS